jgi:hypothetical protein
MKLVDNTNSLDGSHLGHIFRVEVESTIEHDIHKTSHQGRVYSNTYKGGDHMADYKLTVEVLEVRVSPIGFSQGGQ